jgi:hypothetical protein
VLAIFFFPSNMEVTAQKQVEIGHLVLSQLGEQETLAAFTTSIFDDFWHL